MTHPITELQNVRHIVELANLGVVTSVNLSQSLEGKHRHLVIIYALSAQHTSIQCIKEFNPREITMFTSIIN